MKDGPPDRRVVVGTEIPDRHLLTGNTLNDVWRDAATGRELARTSSRCSRSAQTR